MSRTRFPELNAVLDELASGAREALADNFVGAYLQGSFAVGDADEHSDVDYLVVVEREVNEEERRELQALQERLSALETPWAQHLEGSYVPRDQLRRVDPDHRPWFYFDNGSTEPEWDNHDNTAVVRWSVRERGVVLAGPDPKEVLDPVSPEDLRADAFWALDEWEAWLPTLEWWSARFQPEAVLAHCRMLHTVCTGTVGTKPEAAEWTLGVVESGWRPLILEARAQRPDPWPRVKQPADPARIEQTRAFVSYAAGLARASRGTRARAR